MNTINVKYNKATNQISVLKDDIIDLDCDVIFSLEKRHPKEVVNLHDFSLTYTLKLDNQVLWSKVFPNSGIVVQCSNQENLTVDRLNLESDTSYVLDVKFEFSGRESSVSIDIATRLVVDVPQSLDTFNNR